MRLGSVTHPATRRHNHVTPTSYLELLSTLARLLGEKRTETLAQKRRLEVGLEKLMSTAQQVSRRSLQCCKRDTRRAPGRQ